MPKNPNQKQKLLYIMKYFLEKTDESTLIRRLHRFASEHCDAGDERWLNAFEDVLRDSIVERVAIIEIPCLRLEAPLAMMRAP